MMMTTRIDDAIPEECLQCKYSRIGAWSKKLVQLESANFTEPSLEDAAPPRKLLVAPETVKIPPVYFVNASITTWTKVKSIKTQRINASEDKWCSFG